jgi:hypothetical protein
MYPEYLDWIVNQIYFLIITQYFNVAVSLLMEKSRKAYFKMKKTIGLNNPCNLLEKLFYSLVTPILLYCSEVWGCFN